MSDWTDFLNSSKSYVVAAAGHGKTYAIVNCVELLSSTVSKPILILTHTHAGVASIREKIRRRNIQPAIYQIETISSFAQRYVLSLSLDITSFPLAKDDSYFREINSVASILFKKKSVQKILNTSYSHLFVDEYQDCSIIQHQILSSMAEVLPIHIFGDPLQSIFSFTEEPKIEFGTHLVGYDRFCLLETPWRWKVNDNSSKLGDWILNARKSLLENKSILLKTDLLSNIQVFINDKESKDKGDDSYFKLIRDSVNRFKTESTLVIVPSYYDESRRFYGIINDRVDILSRIDYCHNFTLIEAMDDNSFYSTAELIDSLIKSINRSRDKVKKTRKAINSFDFKKGDLDVWFSGSNISRRQKENKEPSEKLKFMFDTFFTNPTLKAFRDIILFFSQDRHYHSKRPDKLFALLKCINESINTGESVYDCMFQYFNNIRRNGRKIEGKCIGTTLLTKGLEFDNVIILDAHRFSDKENFYVAISRACKNLVIITKQQQLSFSH